MRGHVLSVLLLCGGVALSRGCSSGRVAGGEPEYEEGAIIHQVSEADKAALKGTAPLTAERAVLWVNGLGCPLCATNIDIQLKRVRGVSEATVDLSTGKVAIEMPGAIRPSPKRLYDAVEDAGFTLVRIETMQ